MQSERAAKGRQPLLEHQDAVSKRQLRGSCRGKILGQARKMNRRELVFSGLAGCEAADDRARRHIHPVADELPHAISVGDRN